MEGKNKDEDVDSQDDQELIKDAEVWFLRQFNQQEDESDEDGQEELDAANRKTKITKSSKNVFPTQFLT